MYYEVIYNNLICKKCPIKMNIYGNKKYLMKVNNIQDQLIQIIFNILRITITNNNKKLKCFK